MCIYLGDSLVANDVVRVLNRISSSSLNKYMEH